MPLRSNSGPPPGHRASPSTPPDGAVHQGSWLWARQELHREPAAAGATSLEGTTDRLIVYVQKREVSRHIKITKTNKRATVLTACLSRAPGSRLGPLTLITCLSVGPRLPVRLREVAWPVGRCDRHRCGHLGVRTPILFALPGAMPFGGGGTASVGVHLDWPVIIASCPWPRPGQGFGQ